MGYTGFRTPELLRLKHVQGEAWCCVHQRLSLGLRAEGLELRV